MKQARVHSQRPVRAPRPPPSSRPTGPSGPRHPLQTRMQRHTVRLASVVCRQEHNALHGGRGGVGMPVGQRLRYEILRRDDHTCRYCGAKAPTVKLAVDHVVPQALGGTDEPSNLVTACEECNSGKASVPPDADIVADVAKDAVRWATAMKEAAAAAREDYSTRLAYRDGFTALWEEWTYGADNKTFPLPDGWEGSIDSFRAAGLEAFAFEDAIRLAMSNTKVTGANKFRYFCGVAWTRVRQLQDHARAILASGGGPTNSAGPDQEYRPQHSWADCFSLTATAIWLAGRRGQPTVATDNEDVERIVQATAQGTRIGAVLEDKNQWHRLHEVMAAVHDATSRYQVDPNELLPDVPTGADAAQVTSLADEFISLWWSAHQAQGVSRLTGTGDDNVRATATAEICGMINSHYSPEEITAASARAVGEFSTQVSSYTDGSGNVLHDITAVWLHAWRNAPKDTAGLQRPWVPHPSVENWASFTSEARDLIRKGHDHQELVRMAQSSGSDQLPGLWLHGVDDFRWPPHLG
ncbi:HNH endonuclease [Streptomyces sp. NPDC001750]|uniref:HNH endonuclease n=1 Tax=Streptomyces sp. NPDC001750 TaxID=3364607 RepID=UPI0036C90DFA